MCRKRTRLKLSTDEIRLIFYEAVNFLLLLNNYFTYVYFVTLQIGSDVVNKTNNYDNNHNIYRQLYQP